MTSQKSVQLNNNQGKAVSQPDHVYRLLATGHSQGAH